TLSLPQIITNNNVEAQMEKPHTVELLQQQPENPTSVTIRQLAKSAQLVMQSATILAEKNKKLQQVQQLTTEAERVVVEPEQSESSQRRQRARSRAYKNSVSS
ncbi:hypothetical protein GGP41_008394, partial [Bipolaris sorokiniana]